MAFKTRKWLSSIFALFKLVFFSEDKIFVAMFAHKGYRQKRHVFKQFFISYKRLSRTTRTIPGSAQVKIIGSAFFGLTLSEKMIPHEKYTLAFHKWHENIATCRENWDSTFKSNFLFYTIDEIPAFFYKLGAWRPGLACGQNSGRLMTFFNSEKPISRLWRALFPALGARYPRYFIGSSCHLRF